MADLASQNVAKPTTLEFSFSIVSSNSNTTMNVPNPAGMKQQKPPKQPKQKKQQNNAAQQTQSEHPAQPAKRPPKVKGPKGPKGPKPKPKTCQFYYQELANEMAGSILKDNQNSANFQAPDQPWKARESLESLQNVFQRKTITTKTTTTTTTSETTETTETFSKNAGFRESICVEVPESSRASSTSDLTLVSFMERPSTKGSSTASSSYRVCTLNDKKDMEAIEPMLLRYGGTQHGGILDKSYSFFINRAGDAALSFIVKDKVAVIGGDPFCAPELYRSILKEFKEYRKQYGLGVAVFGGSDALLDYAKSHKWTTLRFGTERVLNPMDNPVLQEKAQKQIIKYNRQLLDPARGGLSLGIYSPLQGQDLTLEQQLTDVYDSWREERNSSGVAQAYTTVYDPFAMRNLMIYIFTCDEQGKPNGFAALRRMGDNRYYIDPCIAAPGAHRRIPDLLYFAAMSLLNTIGCSFLSIGMEPATELEMNGFPAPFEKLAKLIHAKMFQGLKLGGKKEYHDKFRPDESQETGLHLMFPNGMPGLRRLSAVIHFSNISIRRLIKTRLDYKGTGKKEVNALEQRKPDEESNDSAGDR